VTTSATTGEAAVIISLFGSLTFGVAVAMLQQVPDRSVITFINPHAAGPPYDTQEVRQDAALFVLNRPIDRPSISRPLMNHANPLMGIWRVL
jgi:hypothetical protein